MPMVRSMVTVLLARSTVNASATSARTATAASPSSSFTSVITQDAALMVLSALGLTPLLYGAPVSTTSKVRDALLEASREVGTVVIEPLQNAAS